MGARYSRPVSIGWTHSESDAENSSIRHDVNSPVEIAVIARHADYEFCLFIGLFFFIIIFSLARLLHAPDSVAATMLGGPSLFERYK